MLLRMVLILPIGLFLPSFNSTLQTKTDHKMKVYLKKVHGIIITRQNKLIFNKNGKDLARLRIMA